MTWVCISNALQGAASRQPLLPRPLPHPASAGSCLCSLSYKKPLGAGGPCRLFVPPMLRQAWVEALRNVC